MKSKKLDKRDLPSYTETSSIYGNTFELFLPSCPWECLSRRDIRSYVEFYIRDLRLFVKGYIRNRVAK